MEVGAGTFHRRTTLRALGHQPMGRGLCAAVAFVRPMGRIGENPNPLAQHYYSLGADQTQPGPKSARAVPWVLRGKSGSTWRGMDIRFVDR